MRESITLQNPDTACLPKPVVVLSGDSRPPRISTTDPAGGTKNGKIDLVQQQEMDCPPKAAGDAADVEEMRWRHYSLPGSIYATAEEGAGVSGKEKKGGLGGMKW